MKPDGSTPTPEEVEAELAELLELAEPPAPREEFRAALRERFTGVARAEPWGRTTQPPHARDALLEEPIESEVGPPRGRRWLQLVSIVAAAAAVVLMFRWPSEELWRVGPASDFVRVRVAGESFAPGESERLAAALRPGAVIEVEGGVLELVLDRRAAFSFAAGSSAMLVEVPARRALGDIVVDQDRGSVAVVTGPEFEGLGLCVLTPFADVRVSGTEFAVDVFPGTGTCVCCTEGKVGVDPHGRDRIDPSAAEAQWSVGGGDLGFISPEGKLAESGKAEADHVAPLASLRRAWD